MDCLNLHLLNCISLRANHAMLTCRHLLDALREFGPECFTVHFADSLDLLRDDVELMDYWIERQESNA